MNLSNHRIRYNASLKSKAQELRRESTPQENKLWYDFLRSHPYQFRRQKQFDRYIVDFYCSRAKLAIEIDGPQHYTPEGLLHDQSRTAHLNSLGITVLRFKNDEIDHRFRSVCYQINKHLTQQP